MESKKCKKCKIEKDFSCFYKQKKGKYGLCGICKYCDKERNKEYYKYNKEKRKEQKKEYYKSNKEKRKEQAKEYYENNKEKIKEKRKEYYNANKEKRKEKRKEYSKEYSKEYYKNNKEKRKEYLKEYRKNNPLFKLRCNLGNRTYRAFKNKGYSKKSKTKEMLGVDWETAKAHIQSQFTKGMNWDNQGEWHIDHIIPLSSAKTEQELIKLCHYRNLQPLWAKDNLEKSNKMPNQQIQFKI